MTGRAGPLRLGGLFLLAGCAAHRCAPAGDAAPDSPGDASGDASSDASGGDSPDVPPLPWTGDHCAGVDGSGDGWAEYVDRWRAQDALTPAAPGQLGLVGSSTIRRWERPFAALARLGVVQRGVGGAWLRDVADLADALVLPARPGAVAVFAGTNDIAGGASAEQVANHWRCLVERVWAGLGPTPMVFVGITPTPARWHSWPTADAANDLVIAANAGHPYLRYADVPTAFLATGAPPAASLFVDDGLHLSEEGYALFLSALSPSLADLPDRAPPPNPLHPAAGAALRVDLGPSNPEDGAPTTTDASGARWSSWHAVDGDAQVLAGERLALVDTTGAATGIELVVTGGFAVNGLQNGGLTDPDPALLGALAVPTATQDFFYVDGPDNPGGLALTGLDPARRYSLRLFASRAEPAERRVTRYVVSGASTAEATLQTSGPELGPTGGNTTTVVTFAGLAPDPWGQLHLDVSIAEGSYAYLSLLELTIEGG